MKKDTNKAKAVADEMRPEYDFSGGVRGKHYREMRKGYRIKIHNADGSVTVQDVELEEGAVVLDPDLREYFKDSEAVNRTLRGLINLMPEKRKTGKKK